MDVEMGEAASCCPSPARLLLAAPDQVHVAIIVACLFPGCFVRASGFVVLLELGTLLALTYLKKIAPFLLEQIRLQSEPSQAAIHV